MEFHYSERGQQPCPICGRTFTLDALSHHQRVCEKDATHPRKLFDSSKQREHEDAPTTTTHKKANKQPITQREKGAWSNCKEKHEDPIRTIKQAREQDDGNKEKRVPSDYYVECGSCGRHFNQKAAVRHEPWCKENKMVADNAACTTEHHAKLRDKELEITLRKEMKTMVSLRKRAEQEKTKIEKQPEYIRKKEEERIKREQQENKKEEKLCRQRKAQEDEDGTPGGSSREREETTAASRGATMTTSKSRSASVTRPPQRSGTNSRNQDVSSPSSLDSPVGRGSQYNFAGKFPRSASVTGLPQRSGTNSRNQNVSSPSSLDSPVGRGSQNNLAGVYSDEVSSEHGYVPSPCRSRNYPHSSPSSPGHLLSDMLGVSCWNQGNPSDGLSDSSSTVSSAWASEYSGPKHSTKSNRSIVTSAIHTDLAGAANSEAKRKVLEEIEHSEGKHFLILFRDAGCQFRALYFSNPETEEVIKLYGIGPRIITGKMMDKFYKYNCGGKSFTQIQTKHLTATIDAFTIQNSLWQGKKSAEGSL